MDRIPRAAGIFNAVVTCDAEALRRKGESFYQVHDLGDGAPEPGGGRLFEILFGDGHWMLAHEDDLCLHD